MFNYIHESIINNAANIVNKDGKVCIKRVGEYVVANIEGKILKTAGHKGEPGSASFDIPDVAAGNLLRITMFISTPKDAFAEFAMPFWQEFGRPFVIETAAKSADAVVDAIKLSLNTGGKYFKVEKSPANSSGESTTPAEGATPTEGTTPAKGTITITLNDSFLDFSEFNVDVITPQADGADEKIVKSAEVTITHSVDEFATATWIRENLRFPSGPNMRYTPLYADEAPIEGVTYTQYSLQYKVDKAAPGGLSGVNQLVSSITTHVFYVHPNAVSEFETAFGGSSKFDPTTDNKQDL